jgi:hypothetical protein
MAGLLGDYTSILSGYHLPSTDAGTVGAPMMAADPGTLVATGPAGSPAGGGGLPAMTNAGATPLGFNLGTAQAALGGLQTIGNMWMAFQANKQAKKQFKFAKQMTRINLANQIQAYNTALADRARSRSVMESQTPEQTQAYFDSNALQQLPGRPQGGFGGGSYSASLSGTGSAPAGTGTAPSSGSGGRPSGGSIAGALRNYRALKDENPGG